MSVLLRKNAYAAPVRLTTTRAIINHVIGRAPESDFSSKTTDEDVIGSAGIAVGAGASVGCGLDPRALSSLIACSTLLNSVSA